MSETEWPFVYRAGSATGPVLLTLHGTGGDEHNALQLADVLDPDAPVLSPRGRVREGGMNRWFRRLGEGVFDVDDVVYRADELALWLPGALAEYGLGGREIVAVGFSNGANMGTALVLLHPGVVRKVIAFSGMYPFAERDLIAASAVDGVQLLLANGDTDPMAPASSVDRLERLAAEHGVSVTRHRRPGGHGVAVEDVAAARAWLQSSSAL